MPSISEQLFTALSVMGLGMGLVFIFLSLMIIVVNFTAKLFPVEVAPVVPTASTTNAAIPAHVVAAINGAIEQHLQKNQ
ncbi:OadG-related small transporter subunit [Paraferrimonas sp. SM1919]|uniref:OadG-related small transporter subunit n=1 Tax=Paraferrimonas sp. SM1919 TaxID=2662263 RepID=UPI0013D34473|nr:OadG-related small transporter subunit [Paraferrimonas sp. SM1919]